MRAIDPTYVDDFWNTPGYEGADPESTLRDDRLHFATTVASVDGSTLTLADAPDGDLTGADVQATGGTAEGQEATIGSVDGPELTLLAGIDPAALQPGDPVQIDNSWLLALEYYHRYQVPEPSLYGWDQFRDDEGEPLAPQRDTLTGPTFTRVFGGGGTGRFTAKMIMVASVMDVEAFAWSADWYRRQAERELGDGVDDQYRLWYTDNADHTPPKSTAAEAHIVDYLGVVEQALLDLDAWVSDDIDPPAGSAYAITEDHAVQLADEAGNRGGIQPVVRLGAAATDDCDDVGDDVAVGAGTGQPVTFSAEAAVPPGAGEIIRVEWDVTGTGRFPAETVLDEPSPDVHVCETHVYERPGTHFAVVRVTSERAGDPEAAYRRVQNLARVRVVIDQPPID